MHTQASTMTQNYRLMAWIWNYIIWLRNNTDKMNQNTANRKLGGAEAYHDPPSQKKQNNDNNKVNLRPRPGLSVPGLPL